MKHLIWIFVFLFSYAASAQELAVSGKSQGADSVKIPRPTPVLAPIDPVVKRGENQATQKPAPMGQQAERNRRRNK